MGIKRLWHRMRGKGKPTAAIDANQLLLQNYESITRLIKHELLEIHCDHPQVFLSLDCYKAFMCDTKQSLFLDYTRARAFLDNVRFYINFTRSYASGVFVADTDLDTYVLPPLSDDEYIPLFVANSAGDGILLYGKWNSKEVIIVPEGKEGVLKTTPNNTD